MPPMIPQYIEIGVKLKSIIVVIIIIVHNSTLTPVDQHAHYDVHVPIYKINNHLNTNESITAIYAHK